MMSMTKQIFGLKFTNEVADSKFENISIKVLNKNILRLEQMVWYLFCDSTLATAKPCTYVLGVKNSLCELKTV